MPTGTLIRNTLRQPQLSTRMPPKVGPMAVPRLAIAVQMPIARAFALGSGNAALTSASEVTLAAAAAIPCTPRATFRNSSDGASPQATEASVNTAMPNEVHAPAAVQVGERRAGHDEDRHAEAVGGDHPLQPRFADRVVALDLRQRHVHHQRVEEDHEEPEAGGHEAHALGGGHDLGERVHCFV